MLNETNSELEERSDKAAADEMMIRTEVQMAAQAYYDDLVDAYERMYDNYMDKLIAKQQQQQEIEAMDWNDRYGY